MPSFLLSINNLIFMNRGLWVEGLKKYAVTVKLQAKKYVGSKLLVNQLRVKSNYESFILVQLGYLIFVALTNMNIEKLI